MDTMLVFVTPLDDGRVEVDTDELYAAGLPPHVASSLRTAAWLVASRYAAHRPMLLFENPESKEAAAALGQFRQAQRDAAALIQWNESLRRGPRRNPLTGHFVGGGKGE